MPFTLLHIGPSLLLGYLLHRRIHLPTLIIASLAVDVEPLITITSRIQYYPLHGYLHTFLLSIPLGFMIGLLSYTIDRVFGYPFRYLSLSKPSNYGFEGYVSAGILGWILHILLDAPLYDDIRPLYPSEANPFYNPNIAYAMFHTCSLLLFASSPLYLRSLYKHVLAEIGREASRIYTGLIAMILGATIATATFTNPVYILLSAAATLWGLVVLYSSLRYLDRMRVGRITLSEASIMVAILASHISIAVYSYRYPYTEVFLTFISNPIFFITIWVGLLLGVILIRPTLRYIGLEAEDRVFTILTDILISGLTLIPILIGILVALPTLILMLSRIPNILSKIYTRAG